jgi:hypothetical protein
MGSSRSPRVAIHGDSETHGLTIDLDFASKVTHVVLLPTDAVTRTSPRKDIVAHFDAQERLVRLDVLEASALKHVTRILEEHGAMPQGLHPDFFKGLGRLRMFRPGQEQLTAAAKVRLAGGHP